MGSGQVTHLATVQSRPALVIIPQHSVGVAAEVVRLALVIECKMETCLMRGHVQSGYNAAQFFGRWRISLENQRGVSGDDVVRGVS